MGPNVGGGLSAWANLKLPVSIIQIESRMNNLTKQKTRGPDSFRSEFCQTFKEKMTPIFYKTSQKIEAEGILFKSFYETNITIIPKSDKESKERKITEHYLPLINTDAKTINKY